MSMLNEKFGDFDDVLELGIGWIHLKEKIGRKKVALTLWDGGDGHKMVCVRAMFFFDAFSISLRVVQK